MTISRLIDELRLEMTDELKTRWTDAQMLSILGKAYRRLAHVLYRGDIEPGRSAWTFDAEPDREAYPLPLDFLADYGLYREDTHARLTKHSEDSFNRLAAPDECSAWVIRGDTLLIAGTPRVRRALRLVYWPLADTRSLAMDSPTPYGGRFDDMVAEYAALRLKNIDEMDATTDAGLLQDFEANVLATFSGIDPATLERRGWLA